MRLTEKMGIFPAVNIINKKRNRKSPSSPWTYSSYLLRECERLYQSAQAGVLL